MIVTLGLIALAAVIGIVLGASAFGTFAAWVIEWLFRHASNQL